MSEPTVDGVALTARLAVIAQARAALHDDRAMLDALTPAYLVPEPVAAQHAALVVLVRDLLKALGQPDRILDALTLDTVTKALKAHPMTDRDHDSAPHPQGDTPQSGQVGDRGGGLSEAGAPEMNRPLNGE